MPVYKDKKRNHYYFVTYVNGKRYERSSVKWNSERKAKLAEIEFLKKYNENEIKNKDLTVKDVGERHIQYLKTNKKPSTIDTYKQRLNNHVYDYFENIKIQTVTRFDIEQYQVHLLNKKYSRNGQTKLYSNNLITSVQDNLRSLFDYAVSHQFIPYNPFDGLENAKHQKPDEKRMPVLITYEEYRQFMSVLDTEDDIMYRALFSTLYWCGLRPGEALGLNIGDVDLKNKRLYISHGYDSNNKILGSTKTDKNRFIGLANENVYELENMFKQYNTTGIKIKDNYPLFGLDKRTPKRTLDNRFNKYRDLSGLHHFTLYDLRRSHVSLLIKLGLSAFEISKRTGHSVEMVNEVYGHLWDDDKEIILDKLNSISSISSD